LLRPALADPGVRLRVRTPAVLSWAHLEATDHTATELSKTVADNRTAVLTRLFLAADANAAICGTRWVGYQAMTEHLDHAAPAHGKTADDKAVNRDLTSPAVAPHHKRPESEG
jgi:hypothetical protein